MKSDSDMGAESWHLQSLGHSLHQVENHKGAELGCNRRDSDSEVDGDAKLGVAGGGRCETVKVGNSEEVEVGNSGEVELENSEVVDLETDGVVTPTLVEGVSFNTLVDSLMLGVETGGYMMDRSPGIWGSF
jgi:hypothetical protein